MAQLQSALADTSLSSIAPIVGLDIGGAHLKWVTIETTVTDNPTIIAGNERFFPFWTDHAKFANVLREILDEAGDHSCIAVTMTAELADCFLSKQAGVAFIVNSIESIATVDVFYYQTNGQLVDASEAITHWKRTAASNWHATACFLARRHDALNGMVVDVGSTTTDLIPVYNGRPVLEEQTDLDRLKNGQLLYAGVGRTPLMSLLSNIAFDDGTSADIARELFATMDDALLYLGETPEQPDDVASADHQPRTRMAAKRRLARVVCADESELDDASVLQVARQARAALCQRICSAFKKLMMDHHELPAKFLLAGSGQAIAAEVIKGIVPDSELAWAEETSSQLIPALAVASALARKFTSDE